MEKDVMNEREYLPTVNPSKIYYSVSLPMSLIEEIRKYIDTDKTYRNVPEFVADAIRDKLALVDVGISTYQKQIMELQKTVIELQNKIIKRE